MSNSFELDQHGFLKDKNDWNESFILAIAQEEQLNLTGDHRTVILFFREFYEHHELTPAMRVIIKYLRNIWPAEKANSHYLQTLFPKSVMLQASRLAGLPKPSRCL